MDISHAITVTLTVSLTVDCLVRASRGLHDAARRRKLLEILLRIHMNNTF